MVRTRFAPSPTGFLHIGGVRTALFNWLFSRHQGGQFILRIDDTDQQRNVAEALEPILRGLRWLGIDWDEGAEKGGPFGPYYQSLKLETYQAAVRELLDKGAGFVARLWSQSKPDYQPARSGRGARQRPGAGPAGGEAQAVYHVVQPALQDAQELLAGVLGGA